MINVNQITTMLSRMELPDLQNYATLHKNDPYIVSLAMSVANTKKQAEVAKNGLAGMQPQPKVVDQQIAQMAMPQPQMPLQQQMPPQMAPQQLPEDSGIGQLPAQNMQGIADGGIVGYAEGGYVPRFNGLTGSVPSANPLDIYNMNPKDARAYAEMLKEAREVEAAKAAGQVPKGVGAANASSYFNQLSKYAKAGLKSLPAVDVLSNLFLTSPEEIATLKKAEALKNNIASIPQSSISGTASAADVDKAVGLPVEPPVVAASPDGKPKPLAANPNQLPPSLLGNAGGQGIKTQPPAGLPSVTSFADQLTGIDKFLPKKEEAPVEDTFMKKREEASKPVWEKFQGTIDKEKSRLNEGKEQDFYMALIEGGLEAAGGNSPNGLQNLAAGFSKGAKSYSVALKDFRKAAQENSKMELDMERARAAEKRGDMDAFQKHEDSIKNRNADIDKLKTSGIFALQNVNTSVAGQLAAAKMQEEGRLASADLSGRYSVMAHGLPNYIERMVSQMPGKTYADQLKAYSEIMGPNAKADSTMLMKYMGMTPAQKALFKRDNPQAAAGFDAQLQVSGLKPVNVSDPLP
jgi:hypothetical protein